jgi:hypothetical protein
MCISIGDEEDCGVLGGDPSRATQWQPVDPVVCRIIDDTHVGAEAVVILRGGRVFHGGPCRVVAEMGANEEGFNAAWEVHDSMMHACRHGRRSDRVGLGQMWMRTSLRVIRAGHGLLSGNLSAGVVMI